MKKLMGGPFVGIVFFSRKKSDPAKKAFGLSKQEIFYQARVCNPGILTCQSNTLIIRISSRLVERLLVVSVVASRNCWKKTIAVKLGIVVSTHEEEKFTLEDKESQHRNFVIIFRFFL